MGPVGTGIVFVVLVAIWVAYFVQYWSRRREHLATARSVEAFAEAMRVLEKRPALRASAGHRVSSAYAMSPARVVSARPAPRPQVIAKPHPTTPNPSRGGAPRMSTPSHDVRPSPLRAGPGHPPARVSPGASGRAPSAPARRSHGRTPSPRMSPSRAVRGLILLASLAATLVTGVLAAFAVLLWWVPLVGVAAVVASFLWLRSGVQAEIAARRASRPARGRVRPPAPAPAPMPRPSDQAEEHEVAGSPTAPTEAELIETTSVTAEAETRPDGWQPVPVPPPTYTLKAKAERPAAAPEGTQVAPEAPAAAPPTDAQGEQEIGRAAAYGT